MIRLTVLYNLPEGADEAEFLRWRLGEHQQSNESMSGVQHTDFGRVDYRWMPQSFHAPSPYRFMTIADWPDRESFEKSFFDPQALAKLIDHDLKKIADPLFIVSEILISNEREG
jgi:hypothetical protein